MLMDTMTQITLVLLINLVMMVYTIVRTKQSNFHADTKTLLYVMAVITPLFGLILFWIKNRSYNKYAAQ
jgi:hypothetical protein